MTRYSKSNGKYQVSGSSYQMLIGSRAQVWHGTAYKTSGGLTKKNIMKNKAGRIVSKAKHSTAKKDNRLVKSGYGTKKGSFGFVKVGSRKMKGGSPYGNSYSPSNVSGSGVDGQGLTNYGSNSTNVQMAAGMAGGRKRKSRKMRGGKGYGWLSGNGTDGQGVTNYGSNSNNVQMAAGMAGGARRYGGRKSMMYGGATMPSTTGAMGSTTMPSTGAMGSTTSGAMASTAAKPMPTTTTTTSGSTMPKVGGRGRKRRGGTTMNPRMGNSNPQQQALNAS